MRRKLTTTLLVGLLLVSSLAAPLSMGGTTGTAEANVSACSILDGWAGASCDFLFGPPSENVEDNYDDQLDLYQEAVSLEARAEVALDNYQNELVSMDTQAKMAGEEAFVRAVYNGRNKIVATEKAVEAVKDTYSVTGNQIIETQNNMVTTLWAIQNKGAGYSSHLNSEAGNQKLVETHDSYPAIEVEAEVNTEEWTGPHVTTDLTGTTQRSVTLPNGEQKSVSVWQIHHALYGLNEESNQFEKAKYSSKDTQVDWSSDGGHEGTDTVAIIDGEGAKLKIPSTYTPVAVLQGQVKAHVYPAAYPDDPHHVSILFDVGNWGQLWSDYQADVDRNVDYMSTWANQSYDPLVNESNDIGVEDVLNKFSLIRNQADLRDPENASFSDVAAALAAQGMSLPSGETAYMRISYQESYNGSIKTNQGLLVSQTEPLNGSWRLDRWYNSTLIPGAQGVVRFDGSVDRIQGDFEIEGVYNKNGTAIADPTINTTGVSWQTSNVSELRDEITNLSNQIADLRNRTGDTGPAAGGGGFQWPGIGIPNPFGFLGALGQWVVIALVAFGALLLLTVLS